MIEKYAWLAVLTLAQIIQFLVMRRNGKKTSNNPSPNSIPGKSQTCIDHGKMIGKMDIGIEFLKEELKEFKKDTEKNFDIVYGELRKRR